MPMAVSLAAKLEAILYLKGKPLRLGELVAYAQCSRQEAEDALIDLMDSHAQREGALEVIETSEGYLLQLRPNLKELIHSLVPVDLGVGVLRSLAAIALKNGLSLSELVDLRGSGAYQHVQQLVAEGFVQKRQHKDSRSAKLRVTEKFHQYFEIERLPEVSAPQITPKAAQLKLELALAEEAREAEIAALEAGQEWGDGGEKPDALPESPAPGEALAQAPAQEDGAREQSDRP